MPQLLAWRATVVRFLTEQGYTRNLVEPCWYMRFNDKGQNESQVLIEVDDFIISAAPEKKQALRECFEKRFHFGKWEDSTAEYAGRLIQVFDDKILIDRQKYILEQIHPVPLSKGRRSEKNAALTPEEFAAFRSTMHRINWVAKESRPEMSGLASIMASKLTAATVEDVLTVNKNVNFLRNTASRPLTLWRMDPENLSFIAISDAGGIVGPSTRPSTTKDFHPTARKELGWCWPPRHFQLEIFKSGPAPSPGGAAS